MFKKIYRLVSNFNKIRLLKISALIFFNSILEIAAFGSIIPLTLVLVDNSNLEKIQIIHNLYSFFEFSSLDNFIVFLAFGILFLNLFLNFYHVMSRHLVEKSVWDQYTFVSKFYLKNVFNKNLLDLENKNLSEYYSKILNELSVVYDIIILSIIDSISKIFIILFILSFLLIINFSITISVIIFSIIIFFIIFKIVGKKLKIYGGKLVTINQDRYESLLQIFRSVTEIKLYKSSFFFQNYDSVFRQYKKIYLYSSRLKKISKHLIEPIFFGLIIFFLILGYFHFRNFNLILPIATTFVYAIVRILPASNAILYNITNIKNFEPHLIRVYPEIKNIYYIKNANLKDSDEYFSKKEKDNFKTLKLKNITFSYPNSSKNFNFNLLINKGEHYKIIGRNGSGKSTLIKIFLGLIFSDTGEYLVNDKILNKNDLLEWQNFLAYVPQEVFLVNNKVLNNIAYGISENKINKILAQQTLDIVDGASDKSNKLKLDLIIENNGSNISGGQKQKIGIARALYLEKKVLIFDESFSAIDIISKKEITKKLLELDCTLIEITHEIKNIGEEENIIAIKNGSVFFQGKKRDFDYTLI